MGVQLSGDAGTVDLSLLLEAKPSRRNLKPFFRRSQRDGACPGEIGCSSLEDSDLTRREGVSVDEAGDGSSDWPTLFPPLLVLARGRSLNAFSNDERVR